VLVSVDHVNPLLVYLRIQLVVEGSFVVIPYVVFFRMSFKLAQTGAFVEPSLIKNCPLVPPVTGANILAGKAVVVVA